MIDQEIKKAADDIWYEMMKIHSADISIIGLDNAVNDIKNCTDIPMTEEALISAFKKMSKMPELPENNDEED